MLECDRPDDEGGGSFAESDEQLAEDELEARVGCMSQIVELCGPGLLALTALALHYLLG